MSEPSPDNSQISGFYGPGSWAAWVILLVSSWIPIYLNEYESNTHFIASALYTNWAAVDILRHLHWFRYPEYLDPDIPLEQVVDAAGAVVFIGTIHSLLQGMVCLFKFVNVAAGTKRHLRRRIFLIHLGLLLPFPAFFYGWFSISPLIVGSYLAFITVGCIVMLFTEVTKPNPLYLTRVFSQKFWNGTPFAGLIVSLIFVFRVGSLSLFGTLLYDDKDTWPSTESLLLDRCHHIPCAPQKMNEWDQVFSLLVALVLFFYEFKTHIFVLSGRLWNALGDWLARQFQSSF